MLEGFFGREPLPEEQMESALLGIDVELEAQAAIVTMSPTLSNRPPLP